MKPMAILVALLAVLLAGTRSDEDELLRRAQRIAQETIILDGHIDTPYRLERHPSDLCVRSDSGEFDYPRAQEGGLNAPFMSIYTPAELEIKGGSKQLADKLIDMVEGFVKRAPDQCAIAVSPADVRRQFEDGKVSLCLGLENGSPVQGDLANLAHFHDRGVRYITLTHSRDNHICDSSYDTTGTWQGMSSFGRKVVVEMNRLGIMIDVSHVSDNAFYQVLELTKAPVIASHSSCRHFLPGFERNISDDMIKLMAEKGGVVQINFGSTFINQKSRAWRDKFSKKRASYLEEHNLERESDGARGFAEGYRAGNPFPFADVSDVADHIDHVVKLVGVDHVGFGSDFDGVGNTLPIGLKDVSQFPNLIRELLERGYSESDLEKICSGNVLRVWETVERVAGEMQDN